MQPNHHKSRWDRIESMLSSLSALQNGRKPAHAWPLVGAIFAMFMLALWAKRTGGEGALYYFFTITVAMLGGLAFAAFYKNGQNWWMLRFSWDVKQYLKMGLIQKGDDFDIAFAQLRADPRKGAQAMREWVDAEWFHVTKLASEQGYKPANPEIQALVQRLCNVRESANALLEGRHAWLFWAAIANTIWLALTVLAIDDDETGLKTMLTGALIIAGWLTVKLYRNRSQVYWQNRVLRNVNALVRSKTIIDAQTISQILGHYANTNVLDAMALQKWAESELAQIKAINPKSQGESKQ